MSIKIELSEPQKQEDIEIMLKNENSGSGGVEDYRDLLNLPKVNGVTLLGNKTSSDLGLQPQGDYALKSSVPTKTSQLTNDSGFVTKHQDISHLATKTELNQKQDTISDLSTIRSNASKGATAVQPSQLSTVAISGSYNDLKDKPVIPEGGGGTVIDAYTKSETDNLLSEKQDKGNYALKSEIPTKTSSLTNDSGFLTKHQDISGKQDIITDLDTIRAGATLGATAVQPNSLGNATITLKQGGVTKGSFTTNQSNDISINLDAGGTGGGGQSSPWVLSRLDLLETATTTENDIIFDMSEYLPDDGLTYLVYGNARAHTSEGIDKTINLYVYSDLIQNKTSIELLSHKNTDSKSARISGVFLVPIGADRTIGFYNSGTAESVITYVRLTMYQQIPVEGSIV